MVVHPRARGEISGSDEVVDARLKEEHDAKEQLSELEKMDIGSKKFLDELRQLQQAVVEHAEAEETEEFNKLQRELDAGDLKLLANAVRPRRSRRRGRTRASNRRS